MMRISLIIALFLVAWVSSPLQAREMLGFVDANAPTYNRLTTDCNDATSQIDLDINNARVRLLGAGDFWWDLNDAVYVIPKVDPTTGAIEVSSMFAGALWIGGIDAGGQLKIAAQTYRQSGNDFWPGPLNDDGSINQDICASYDRHWKVTRQEIDDHIALAAAGGGVVAVAAIPDVILEWPAKGNPYARGKNEVALTIDRNLAPYVDVNADGIYDPSTGDYPDVDGDQAIFWVYNDKGNIHTETNGDAIGLEIQAVAFGFQTSDEINDMTFYKYRVLNFSTSPLDSTYFGQWVDADLGAYDDDFVGCDTALSLGMCYNGDAIDGPTSPNYGGNPPIIGTDFFQGPKKFFNNGGVLDSVLLGMSAFLYYDNDFSVTGNPEVAAHFYGYLTGTWKDGSPFTQGGNGYGGTDPTNFLFPDNPSAPLPAWSECSEGNTPFDRRYLQSSGPFRLEPGAKNEVVVGVVWVAQDNQTGCAANFDLIRAADEKAQALFDSDFQLIDGPDAPDLGIRELDGEILIQLTNGPTSNNAGESYEESDPIIKNIVENDPTGTITDSTYNFEGYILYQLQDAQVSAAEYNNPDKARIVAQVDVKNGIDKLVNLSFDTDLGVDVPELMVDGNDAGILHSFRITEDLFAEGDKDLVNHRTYYFSVVAYAYNNFAPYDPSNPNTQKLPYLQGRKNVKTYTAIPHISTPENSGTVLGSQWGDGPELTRLEGQGSGGRILEITAESEARILANVFDPEVTYQGRGAPVDVMVADPLKIPAADFELTFTDLSSPTGELTGSSTNWTLTNLTTGESISSDLTIDNFNEQLTIDQTSGIDWGMAVTASQVGFPGRNEEDNNGLIEATIEYAEPSKAWLTGLQDFDGTFFQDWVCSDIADADDPDQVFETVLGGTWTAGKMACKGDQYNVFGNIVGLDATQRFEDLASVDIVFTSDKSKWSRSAVVETGEDGLSPVSKSDLKPNPSVDQNGNPESSGFGQGWFPGYAIDLETGTRLNIAYGEATFQGANRGNDMLWNPTDQVFDPVFSQTSPFGGKHYVYVLKTPYDECATFIGDLQTGDNVRKRDAWNDCIWVGKPLVIPGERLLSIQEGLIPTETRVRFRVTQPLALQPQQVNTVTAAIEQFGVIGENGGQNRYRFSTTDLAARVNDVAALESACDLINVVPNPYYAFSTYETSPLDNRIKITNLPPRATVSIYMLDGTLIRRFERDVAEDNTAGSALNETGANLDSSLDWDLNNTQDIPVASGIYLIHVASEGNCERTIKAVVIQRPIDLDTF